MAAEAKALAKDAKAKEGASAEARDCAKETPAPAADKENEQKAKPKGRAPEKKAKTKAKANEKPKIPKKAGSKTRTPHICSCPLAPQAVKPQPRQSS